MKNIDWISNTSNDNVEPIGLKYKDEDDYFEVLVFKLGDDKKKVLISNIIIHNMDNILGIIYNVIERVKSEHEVKKIYQVMQKKEFNLLYETKWNKYKDYIQYHIFNDDNYLVKFNINYYLDITKLSFIN